MPAFGTSGLRGLAEELTDDLVARYAAGFASVFPYQKLLIGRDRRESTPRIAAAVARGAASAGLEVTDCGVLPTPALALAAEAAGALAVMVTGSHIPADRNGLKFYVGGAEIGKADEPALIAAAERAAVTGAGRAGTDREAAEAYAERYLAFLPPGALRGRRIGVWLHSSAAGEVLPRVLTGLGATVVPLGPSEDFVPVDTEAVEQQARANIAIWTLSERLDALVSTDGDADRPLMADETGQILPGDVLGPLAARWLGADEVVTTVSANTLVERMGVFGAVMRTRIGSPYVIAAMEGRGRAAGYEPNGGFLLGWNAEREGRRLSRLMTRDALLPMLAVLADAAGRGVTVSTLLDGLPERRTATDRLKAVPPAASARIVNALLSGDYSVLPDDLGAPEAVDTTEGARMTFAGGAVVTVRASGNAPELRAYVEADSEEAARVLLAVVMGRLRRAVF